MRRTDPCGQGSGAVQPAPSLVSLWAMGPSVPISALVAAAKQRTEINSVALRPDRACDARALG